MFLASPLCPPFEHFREFFSGTSAHRSKRLETFPLVLCNSPPASASQSDDSAHSLFTSSGPSCARIGLNTATRTLAGSWAERSLGQVSAVPSGPVQRARSWTSRLAQ